METQHIISAITLGTGATLLTDIWNFFLKRTFNIPSLNFCLLGRWILHMPGGTFRHAKIADSSPKPSECIVGWISHYSIGVMLALGFIVVASPDWLAQPTLPPSLVYGIVTIVFPFFLMQPSFGMGYAASKTPNPMQARLKSLMTHTMYGVGLWVFALALNHVLWHPSP